MDFYLSNGPVPHPDAMETRLVDFPSKHVLSLSSEKAGRLWDASLASGYPEAMWGYAAGIHRDARTNRAIQLQTVRKMVYQPFIRPFRMVRDSSGTFWPDNLHSAIRDILVFGDGVKLSEVPFYLIDLSGGVPKVYSHMGALSDSVVSIRAAVESARKRDRRATDAVRAVSYRIADFLADNGIDRDALALPDPVYGAYRSAWEKTFRKGVPSNGFPEKTER